MLERQKSGYQEARGVPLPMPEATYEEITKTGAGRHGDRQSIKERRVRSLENAFHRGDAKREEAEMVRPPHERTTMSRLSKLYGQKKRTNLSGFGW